MVLWFVDFVVDVCKFWFYGTLRVGLFLWIWCLCIVSLVICDFRCFACCFDVSLVYFTFDFGCLLFLVFCFCDFVFGRFAG